MVSTFPGKVRVFKEVCPKAPYPMVPTFPAKVIAFNGVLKNACTPMAETVDGMNIYVIDAGL